MASKSRLPVASNKKPIPVKIVYDKSTADKPEGNDKWRIESALRTLQEAEKFKKDKPLMKQVKSLAKEQIKALSNVK